MPRSSRRRSGDREGGGETPARVAGAGGVVFNARGEVLLICHRRGSWVFPKGHIDAGETPLVAAVREVEEEAGVTAHAPDPAVSWTTEYQNDRGEARTITWFRLVTDATAPILREAQFPDGEFLPAPQALETLSFAEDRKLLEAVLASTEGDRT